VLCRKPIFSRTNDIATEHFFFFYSQVSQAMAQTLMATTRPYVLLSSTRASLYRLFQSSKRPFASFSAPLVRFTNSRCVSAVLSRKETAPSSIYGNRVSRVSGFGALDIRSLNFSTKSSQINDAGSIDQTLMQSMELKVGFLYLIN